MTRNLNLMFLRRHFKQADTSSLDLCPQIQNLCLPPTQLKITIGSKRLKIDGKNTPATLQQKEKHHQKSLHEIDDSHVQQKNVCEKV